MVVSLGSISEIWGVKVHKGCRPVNEVGKEYDSIFIFYTNLAKPFSNKFKIIGHGFPSTYSRLHVSSRVRVTKRETTQSFPKTTINGHHGCHEEASCAF